MSGGSILADRRVSGDDTSGNKQCAVFIQPLAVYSELNISDSTYVDGEIRWANHRPEITGLTTDHLLCGGTTYPTITVSASDDLGVKKVQLQYSTDGVTYNELHTFSYSQPQKSKTSNEKFGIVRYADSGTYYIRAIAWDTWQ